MHYREIILMEQMLNNATNWRSILIKFAVLGSVVIIGDFVLAAFLGPQLWSDAAYFFGTDARTTVGVLMFIEGAILLALGAGVGIDGKVVFYGKYGKTYQYDSKNLGKPPEEKKDKQNDIGKILVLTGGTILIVSIIVVMA